MEPIAITGMGLVTPLGHTPHEFWRALLSGTRTARSLHWPDQRFTSSGMPAGELPDVVPSTMTDEPVATEPASAYVYRAAVDAWRESGLEAFETNPARRGIVLGTSKGGLRGWDESWRATHRRKQATSLDWLSGFPHAAGSLVAHHLNCRGPVSTPVAACSTGLAAVIQGANLIRQGLCDVVLAGSGDASLEPIVLGSFSKMGVLAAEGLPPEQACRPFDRERSGFLIGEGTAVFVLERAAHARARGAHVLAEWIDGMGLSDPEHLTRPNPEGIALSELITRLLDRTNLSAAQIDAVSVHGTGTSLNDLAESRAIVRSLGPDVPCFGIKGQIGHLLGAAGSVELAAGLLALRHQVLPATVNCDHQDPACGLKLVRNSPLATEVDHLLKLSLGFGGGIFGGILRRFRGRDRDADSDQQREQ